LFGRVHAVETQLGQKIPTIDVMEQWAAIIKEKQDVTTILVADSYYLTEDARSLLSDLGVRYLCSITKGRFYDLVEEVKSRVEKPGQWTSSWNDDTGELLTFYWNCDKNVGKKYTLTNALFKEQGRTPKHSIPGYDMYTYMFSLCDQFNRGLHDCTWPHRNGGGKQQGTSGTVHDFYFSAILQNTMHAWFAVNSEADQTMSFKTFALELADELYEEAVAL
jgi:hypothetical protein